MNKLQYNSQWQKSPQGKAWLSVYRKARYKKLKHILYPAWKEKYYDDPDHKEKRRKATFLWRMKKKFERENKIYRCAISTCRVVITSRQKYCPTCRKIMLKFQHRKASLKSYHKNKK